MRIDRIHIENLASLRGAQATIDLQSGELGDAGLIAITGATGAGKSTILDAVCLALFDQTPRLHGRGRDPRELLSRGTGEAKAAVDLTLDDQTQWTAEWSVHRARGRADGALQASKQRILDRSTGEVLADQKKAVRAMVEGKLGLSFEQFTGVILLAQGQFAKFLESSDADRSELLERLTGTEIYSELGSRAFERFKELKQKVAAEEDQRQELVLLSAEDRRRMEQEQDALEPNLARLEEQLQGLEQQIRWVEEGRRLRQRREEAQQALTGAEGALESAEPDRRRIARAEAAASVIGALHRLDDAREAERKHRAQLADAEQAVAQLETESASARHGLQRRLDLLQRQKELSKRALNEVSGFAAADAEAVGAFREARQTAKSNRQRSAQIQQEMHEARAQLSLSRQEVEQGRDRAREASARADSLSERRQEVTDRLQAVLAGSTSERLNTDLVLLQQAEEIRRELDELDPEPLEEEVAGLELELKKAVADSAACRALAESSRRELDDHEKLLRLAHEGAQVAAHRHLLREGEPCPLCGSESHPFVDGAEHELPEEERSVLRQAHDRQDALRAELRRAEAEVERAEKRRLELVDELARRRERAHKTRLDFQQRGSRWVELRLQLIDLPMDPFSISGGRLGSMLKDLRGRLESLAAVSQEQDGVEAELKTAEDLRRQAAQTLALAEERHKYVQARLQELEQQLERAEQESSESDQSLRTIARELAEACGLSFQETGSVERDRDEQDALNPQASGVEADEPHGALDDFYRRLTEGRKAWQRAHERFRRLAELSQSLCPRGDRLLADEQWPKLDEGRGAGDAEGETTLGEIPPGEDEVDDGALDPLVDLESQLAQPLLASLERVDAHLSRYRLATDRLSRAQQAQASAEDLLAGRSSELEQQLGGSPFEDEQDLRAGWMSAEELDALRRRLEELRLAAERSRADLQRSTRDLEDHGKAGAQLGIDETSMDPLENADLEDELRRQRHGIRLRRKELADRSLGLRLELEKDQERRQRRETLDQRLETSIAARDRAGRLSQLIGQKDGGKFRRFAQQLNLGQLLGLANRRLEHLAPRYALASVSGSLDLEVIDRDMADEQRPVSTLSGGESFLVSLALALALADLRRGQLRLGTLFLDEGFGSLDQETLDTALSTLEQLQADQATKILIISHVGALQERIPHRIEVEKHGGGRSRLAIKVGD